MDVAYLGPQGSFSQEAALRALPGESHIPLTSLQKVWASVEKGECQAAILPIENSVEGVVPLVMDLLVEGEAQLVGEVILSIKHNLLGRAGQDLGGVKRIYSHPQALSQCRRYLETHLPQAQWVSTSSTSEGARMAKEDPQGVAVGSEGAALAADLTILASAIQMSQGNATRFGILGRWQPEPTGYDKTSLVISPVRDQPGTLYRVLHVFAQEGINLTRIESRPTKRFLGEYLFFLDLEGHLKDPSVHRAMQALKAESSFTKVLGSYPRGEEIPLTAAK